MRLFNVFCTYTILNNSISASVSNGLNNLAKSDISKSMSQDIDNRIYYYY